MIKKQMRTPDEIAIDIAKKPITVSLNKLQLDELQAHADSKGVNVSVLMDEAIRGYLEFISPKK